MPVGHTADHPSYDRCPLCHSELGHGQAEALTDPDRHARYLGGEVVINKQDRTNS